MTKIISLTIDEALLEYLDELAEINGRTRSNMIAWLITKEKQADELLNEDPKQYE